MHTRSIRLGAALAAAFIVVGCSRPAQTSGPLETASATPVGIAMPTDEPGALTPEPTPTASASTASATVAPSPDAPALPSPSGAPPANLLSWASGAIPRVWPEPADGAVLSAGTILGADAWGSKRGARPPFTFVFELAGPAMLERVGFTVPSDGRAQNAETVRVAFSTASPVSGFTDAGTYTLTSDGPEQSFPLSRPTAARWVRLSVDPMNGPQARLQAVSAYGTIEHAPQDASFAGTWVTDERANSAADPLFGSAGRLRDTGAIPAGAGYGTLKTIQRGTSVQGYVCGKAIVWRPWRAELRGDDLHYTSTQVPAEGTIVRNREGTILVGTVGTGVAFVAFRVRESNPCATPSVGQGKTVTVLTMRDAKAYIGAGNVPPLRGYRFVPVPAPLLRPQDLAGTGVTVMGMVCLGGQIFADWQVRALMDYVKAGHTLIIHDSDGCKQTDYSFLPYFFKSSNPGATGAHGKMLVLVESNTLGADRSDPAHFLDVKDYVAHPQDLGDANTVYTEDPHWCGHLFGTNSLNVGGFTQMYAHYGRGLIIYNGLDYDDTLANPQSLRLLRFELEQRADGFLPCSQPVAGSFQIAPSSRRPFVAGRRQRVTIPLQVLANQGWHGTVDLSIEKPANADWPAALSPPRMMMHGNVAPVRVSIDAPPTAKSGTYEFTVRGTDGHGHDAQALITLYAGRERNAIRRSLATTGRATIYGIHFDFDSDRIRPESRAVLSEIGEALRADAGWRLVIEGHTDRVGSDAYNRDLSARRASAVKSALVADYGVNATRLSTVGYGSSRPKASNDSAAGRALNRRVELVR